MNEVDRYLISKGWNLDGSRIKKGQSKKQNSKNIRTEFLLASKKEMYLVKKKKEMREDRKRG